MSGSVKSVALTPAMVAFIASPRLRKRASLAFRTLQRVDPIHRSPLGLVILSRHHEVHTALRSPALGSDERKADASLLRIGPLARLLGSPTSQPRGERAEFLGWFDDLMLFRDPPDHTRLRSLVSKAFTPSHVQQMQPRIEAIAEELLEPLIAGRSMELMSDFAYPFPARVICDMLGVPADGVALFVRFAPALAVALDPDPMRTQAGVARANEAVRVLGGYIGDLVASRRTAPTDDLLSALVLAEADGDRLTEQELVATVLLLVIAGHETTANVIGNGTRRLIANADLHHALADSDATTMRNAVEEFLRLDGPVQMVERIALEPTAVGECALRHGQIAILLLGAANTDPAVFDDPARFRTNRERNPHVAFGGGHHFCIGAPLARLELAIAMKRLAQLPATLRLDGRPMPRQSFTIRGLQSLKVVW